MPDLISLLFRRWKFITGLTLAATVLALLACLVSPKKYAGIVTALPANSVLNDKAHIFNQNIEGLYAALGSADELDKLEGTAKLDTIYLALAKQFNLASHYQLNSDDTAALYKAALRLKKATSIQRTGYGELQIKVLDKDNRMAAALANGAFQQLNDIHQQLQMENNRVVLQRLKEEFGRQQQNRQGSTNNSDRSELSNENVSRNDTANTPLFSDQLAQYSRLINEYEIALKTTPRVLLAVETARPLPVPDQPRTVQTVLLAFVASLLFSFLLALFTDSRKQMP